MFRIDSKKKYSFKKLSLLLFGLPLYSIESTFYCRKITIFNKFIIKSKLYSDYPFYDNEFTSFHSFSDFLTNTANGSLKPVLLWIDQGLGGGTQSYCLNKFKEYKNSFFIVRLQYFHQYDSFAISCPNGESYTGFTLSFDEVTELLDKILFAKIVINSLVTYRNVKDVLSYIHQLCIKNISLKIIYNVHDFFFICPNCNLVDSNDKFCGFTTEHDCLSCINFYKSKQPDYENQLFYGEYDNPSQWRTMWQKILLEVADEVVCFSKSSCELVSRFYPNISAKLRLIPHLVRPLRAVNIEPHNCVNLAVLGKVDSIPKGKAVVEQLSISIDKLNKESANQENDSDQASSICIYEKNASSSLEYVRHKKVNILCIGDYMNAPQNMVVTGTYKRENLPDLLEKNQIDLILIPSICAETFSYTTSEAISMNVPVACFNLGGQADQVSVYPKGLILELSDSADIVLDKILDFLSKLS